MNEEAQVELKRILAKEPHELTGTDIAFLKARYSYVGKNSRAKFAEVLSTPSEKPQKEKIKEDAKQTSNSSQTKEEKKNDPTKFPGDDGEDEEVLDPTTGKAIDPIDEDDEE